MLKLVFVARNGGVGLRVSSNEGGEAFTGLGDRAETIHGERVGAQGAIFVAAFFVDLAKMVAHFTVVAQRPGGCDVLVRLIKIALIELDPSQSVPVGDERGNQRQFLLREAV